MMAIIADIIASVRAAANGDLALRIVTRRPGALEFFNDGVAQRLRGPR